LTEGFDRLERDLTDAQRIQLLRAKVQRLAGRILDGVVAGNAYSAAQDDATRIALLTGAWNGT
jgi:hypothetical protein